MADVLDQLCCCSLPPWQDSVSSRLMMSHLERQTYLCLKEQNQTEIKLLMEKALLTLFLPAFELH